MNYNIGKMILNCIIRLTTHGLMALVIKKPLVKFLEDLVKLFLSRLVVVLDRIFLLSHQVSDFKLGWLT